MPEHIRQIVRRSIDPNLYAAMKPMADPGHALVPDIVMPVDPTVPQTTTDVIDDIASSSHDRLDRDLHADPVGCRRSGNERFASRVTGYGTSRCSSPKQTNQCRTSNPSGRRSQLKRLRVGCNHVITGRGTSTDVPSTMDSANRPMINVVP